jgi:predicted PurR-regulated permease PerM
VGGFSGANVLSILVFLIAYRLFQDYVMQPYLLGAGVELHPALVIFGVSAGGELAGIAGSFLSIPTLALLRIIYRRVLKSQSAEKLVPA